jgi:hypothetical protein
MNVLDLNVKLALGCGLVLTAVQPRSKEWIDLDLIESFEGWQRAKEQHGRHINAAVHLNPSDLCILDLDTPEAFRVLSGQIALPPTMTVRTARGLHLYFRRGSHPGSAGEVWVGPDHLGQYLCGNTLAHYALLPGSVHPSGVRYTWQRGPYDGIADLPSGLFDWIGCDRDRSPYEDFDGDWDD